MKIQPALTCVAVLAAAVFLASCGTTKPAATASASDQSPAASQTGAKPATPGATGQAKPPVGTSTGKPAASVAAINDPNNILSKRSVFYDYDSYDVKAEFRALVEAHARHLRDNPGARMTLEGNCDERGSREYNVALGQKRAEGVKKMMTLLGAREQQIEAVSFGEEKPRAAGTGEAAWAQNRRSDIIYSRAQ